MGSCSSARPRKALNALLIIDVQHDFLPPDGSLAVKDGDKVIPVINDLRKKCTWDTIALSQDWHPSNHVSFASNNSGSKLFEEHKLSSGMMQMMWPDHCVQESRGAQFHQALEQEINDQIIRKGADPNVDSYSAFYDNDKKSATELAEFLRRQKIDQVFVTGLAFDYCVCYTALDAIREGFTVYVIEDATRGVSEDTVRARRKDLLDNGVRLINANEVGRYLNVMIAPKKERSCK